MIQPQLPAPATMASLESLDMIIEQLSLFFLNLHERQELQIGGGTFVLAAEYEPDGSPCIGYRFTEGQRVADVAAALDAYAPKAAT